MTKRGGKPGSGDKTWRETWIWRQNVAANLDPVTKRGGKPGSYDKTWRQIWIKMGRSDKTWRETWIA